jgi:energy-converting hydrogenase A subunit R
VKRVFISDCEGPISKNDNAYEITSHFIPNGNKLFTVISSYDDVTADVLRRPGYKPGNTLKLIVPFFKAFGVTDQKMRDFSSANLLLIPNAKETLQHIRNIAHAYVVSTSYEHYVKALCQTLAFPYENTHCTKLSIDKYQITLEEKTRMRQTAEEIAKMPVLEVPPNAQSLKNLSDQDRQTIQRLDEIFWKEITNSKLGTIYSEVDPVGGGEKAEAIEDVAQKLGINLADIMYVGDSITDEEAFKLVKENGGLAASFNGNRYAIKSAEIAVLSETSLVTAVVADVFCRFGKHAALILVENWNYEALGKSKADKALLNRFFKLCPQSLPKVKIITVKNMEALAKESGDFRKKVRGEAIGKLG